MRKSIKNKAINTIAAIEKCHKEICDLYHNGKLVEILPRLEECQNAAIVVGTAVEESEGEGTEIVSALEEYCELLYKIQLDISENDAKGLEGILSETASSLKNIHKLANEIHVKKEAVFLPYKAAMWDALESVWKKLSEDPEYEAIVIPIPYYDKNPVGTFREVHYEADEYPKNVKVTSYNDYNLEENHPDEIYIHNPYDECNFVTSVHPYFYSKKLREYTERLIYIPYFVLADPNPDDVNTVERIGDFAQTPGVINADEVWVQSEPMRMCYIKALTNWAGKDTRKIWEGKIKAVSSPKIDKVTNTVKDEVIIPSEWQSILQASDGSSKKVVFYNTTVSGILNADEDMLNKIEWALHIFYENREKIALLWRPHPLTEATIRSMRPALWPRYNAIVEKYKSEGWGIYDDTPDLNRAIALSDAYYGDGSSVVELFKTVKKPIMIQNVHIVGE